MASKKTFKKMPVKDLLEHMKTFAPEHAKSFEALTASFVKCDKTEIRIEVLELSSNARGATNPKTIAKLAEAAREYFEVASIKVWVCVGGLM